MHKLSALNLPWPTDWTAIFGRAAPLIVEIGFGRGQFLFHLASSFPDHNVIGLEISNECLVRAEKKIERGAAANLRVVHTPAETALHHLFEPGTLRQVHVNFPDPWFKTSHSHRRLIQRDTLDAIVSRMETGGLFYVATDIIDYATMSADLLAQMPGLDNRLDTPWADAMPGRVTTKYEATAREEGRACYYFAYRRNDQPAPPVPVIKELEMPHLILAHPLPLDEILARFEQVESSDGDIAIKIIYCYQGRHSLLFEVYVKEPTIEQRIAFILNLRVDGSLTLAVSPLGHPRATPGIHRAVALLGDWLASLHPDARIVDSHVIKT